MESGTLIEDRVTARVADLCNALYEVILQVLSRYYIHDGETPAELETLARTAKYLMNGVMRPLGSVLTTLPIGPSHPGRTAGPALEITRPAYFVLPRREPAWKIISERLDVLTETCGALAEEPGLAVLGDLAAKLRSMAEDIRTHLGERASPLPRKLTDPQKRKDMPATAPSFENDIKPLFRESDRAAMLGVLNLDLWSFDDVTSNAARILEAVSTGKMPCDMRWSSEKFDLLRRWIDSGTPR